MRSFAAKLRHFFAQVAGFNAVANCDVEFFQVDRLANEIVRAAAQRGDCLVNQHVGGNHYYDRVRLSMTNLTQHVKPRPVGQVNVKQHRGGWLGIKGAKGGVGGFSFDRFIAPTSQGLSQRPTNHLLVVDDENFMLLIFQGVLLAFHFHPALRERSDRMIIGADGV